MDVSYVTSTFLNVYLYYVTPACNSAAGCFVITSSAVWCDYIAN